RSRRERPCWILAQPFGEAGLAEGQAAQSVVAGTPVEAPRAILQRERPRELLILGFLRFLLHEGIGVLREAARRGEQQSFVSRALREEALDQLQTEGRGGAHQLGIVVGGECRAALRDGVAEAV